MEDGVDVVEDVLRAECAGEVAVAVGDEFEAEAGGEGGDEIGVEVGDATMNNSRIICIFQEFNLLTKFIFFLDVEIHWQYRRAVVFGDNFMLAANVLVTRAEKVSRVCLVVISPKLRFL